MMHKIFCFLLLSLSLSLLSCSVKLASITDKKDTQIQSDYKTIPDVAYSSGKEQTMDIYLSANAEKLKNKNYTIVFLHGGGYYISDKKKEERYIQPYLKKGMNVVNMNYRLQKGIPVATEDLTTALNYLKANNDKYHLQLNRVIVTGFSAGAHIASLVAVTANNSLYPNKLNNGIHISGVINFSGPVDGLDIVEHVFINNDEPIMKEIGNALFTSDGYAPKDTVVKYNPITYFDKNDPPFFLWYGGKDDQVPPATFTKFAGLLNENKRKNKVMFLPDGFHSPGTSELQDAYQKIFNFLDRL